MGLRELVDETRGLLDRTLTLKNLEIVGIIGTLGGLTATTALYATGQDASYIGIGFVIAGAIVTGGSEITRRRIRDRRYVQNERYSSV